MDGKDIKQAIIILVSTAVLILLTSWISSFFNKSPVAPPRPVVGCSSDYQSYSELIANPKHVVFLINSRSAMFAKDGKFINAKVVVTKNDTTSSKVKCGYLFVQAGTDRGALSPQWEDVVVKPSDFGGHLVQDSAIWVNNGALYSQYLYPLDKIQYWGSHLRAGVLNADWTQLLNVSDTVPFLIALNTINRSGFVDQITIVYKCYNPQSGEENTGCNLSATPPQYQQTDSPVQ